MRNTEENYGKLLIQIAANIKAARTNKKLRQADMIEFGFSERFIQKVESGNYSPNLYTIHRIAEALNMSAFEIFKTNK